MQSKSMQNVRTTTLKLMDTKNNHKRKNSTQIENCWKMMKNIKNKTSLIKYLAVKNILTDYYSKSNFLLNKSNLYFLIHLNF